MDASKENAKEALRMLSTSMTGHSQQWIRESLEAAVKRLPSKLALEKDRGRKRTKKPSTTEASK